MQTDFTPTLAQVIEALLLLAEEPVSKDELVQWIQMPPLSHLAAGEVDLESIVEDLVRDYEVRLSPLELRSVAGGWQFFSRPSYAPYLQLFLNQKEQKRLSKSALETLAIVAYRQPITRSELEHIRGVSSDYAVQKLLEKELIEPAGRAELPGKPLLYRTTRAFLNYFGLNELNDLPKLKELAHEEETTPQNFYTPEVGPQVHGQPQQPNEQ